MQVEEVDDIAEPHPIDDIAERAAKHKAERKLVAALLPRAIHHATPTAIAAVIATSSQRSASSFCA